MPGAVGGRYAGRVKAERLELHSFYRNSREVRALKYRLIGQDSVRLLKIDVEGCELEVFRGLDWSCRFHPASKRIQIQTTTLDCQAPVGAVTVGLYGRADMKKRHPAMLRAGLSVETD